MYMQAMGYRGWVLGCLGAQGLGASVAAITTDQDNKRGCLARAGGWMVQGGFAACKQWARGRGFGVF